MPWEISLIILVAAVGYVAVLIVEAFTASFSKRWFAEITLLSAFLLVLHLTTGFPGQGRRQAFGDGADLAILALLMIAVLAGMAARYFFTLRGEFRWRSFLKPFFVSPIVLLPLLGTIPFGGQLEVIQIVCFAILAFQNGFFWRAVYEHAKKKSIAP